MCKKDIQQQTAEPAKGAKHTKEWSLLESFEVIIMSSCILLLLFGAATFVYWEWIKTPVPQVIELRVSYNDSIPNSNIVVKEDLDSLISYVNNTMAAISDHYETVDQSREEDGRMKSLGTLLLGVISSIALFFGYRSFKDIKDKGEQMASNVAKTTAQEVATDTATATSKDYFEKTMPGIVKQQVDTKFSGEGKDALIQTIKEQLLSSIADTIKKEIAAQIKEKQDGIESEDHEQPIEQQQVDDAQTMFESQPKEEDKKTAEEGGNKDE